MPFSSCPMSVARFAMPPHRCCMTHKRLWAAPLHRFWIQIPAISPASKKSRPQWNMGKVENILLLLTLFILLLQGQKIKKESEWQHRKNNINWWNSTSNCSTTLHLTYVSHVSFLDLFCLNPLGGPNWQLHWARVGSPHRGFGTPTSNQKIDIGHEASNSMPDESTKLLSFLQQQKITNLQYIISFFVYSLYHIKSYPSIWSICFSELSSP